jgi:hypothetical protein
MSKTAGSIYLITPDELDAVADRLKAAGARGPASHGNLAFASEEEVRLLRRAANTIRALSGQPEKEIPPPYRPEGSMWTVTRKP